MSYRCGLVLALALKKGILSSYKKLVLGFICKDEGLLACHFLEVPTLQITRNNAKAKMENWTPWDNIYP